MVAAPAFHINLLNIRRGDVDATEPGYPLKTKVLKRCTVAEQALQILLRDGDPKELQVL
jgi:hypothetical protein